MLLGNMGYAQNTPKSYISQLHLIQSDANSYNLKKIEKSTVKSIITSDQIELSIEKANSSKRVDLIRQNIFDNSVKIYTATKEITDQVIIPSNYLYMNEEEGESILLTQTEELLEVIVSNHDITEQLLQISDNELWVKTNKTELTPPPEYPCATEDSPSISIDYDEYYKIYKSNTQNPATIDLYLEIDYALYVKLNEDLNQTMIWVSQVFSQIDLLYSMHNIQINISGIKIWDQEDPYATNYSIRQILPQFGASLKNDFEGQAALFLSGKVGSGGLAWVDKLCAAYDPTNHSGPYGVNAYINTTVASGMTENYNARVIAHELGHIIGSQHTHMCVWGPNNNEAYDGCYSTQGDCNRGTIPEDGGTIMSYCYLNRDVGVNFHHGFGDEPGALLYAKVKQANCRTCSPGDPCDDGYSCTTNDAIDDYCDCVGLLKDVNHNNICDDDEACPDVNLNDICDMEEDCIDHINLDTMSVMDQFIMASKSIRGSRQMSSNNSLVLNAGNSVELLPGFEIQNNTSLTVVTTGCKEN